MRSGNFLLAGAALLCGICGALAQQPDAAEKGAAPWHVVRVAKLSSARGGSEASAPDADSPKYLHVTLSFRVLPDAKKLHKFRVIHEGGEEVGELWGFNDSRSSLVFAGNWTSLTGLYLDGLGHREPLFALPPPTAAQKPGTPPQPAPPGPAQRSAIRLEEPAPAAAVLPAPDRAIVTKGGGDIQVGRDGPLIILPHHGDGTVVVGTGPVTAYDPRTGSAADSVLIAKPAADEKNPGKKSPGQKGKGKGPAPGLGSGSGAGAGAGVGIGVGSGSGSGSGPGGGGASIGLGGPGGGGGSGGGLGRLEGSGVSGGVGGYVPLAGSSLEGLTPPQVPPPRFVLYISTGEETGPGKVYQVDDTGRVLGVVRLPYAASGIALHRNDGLILALPRDGGKIMRIDDTGKLSTLLEKDKTLPHPVDVAVGGNSDAVVVADNIADLLATTTSAGDKPSVCRRFEGQQWVAQQMSIAVTKDKHLIFGTDGDKGVYRFSADEYSAAAKPLLPAPGGVAADAKSLEWAATQEPDRICVFDGEELIKTLRLPANKGIYRQGLLSFAPAGGLCVAVRNSDQPAGEPWLLLYDIAKDEIHSLFRWEREKMVDFVVGPRMPWDRKSPGEYKSIY